MFGIDTLTRFKCGKNTFFHLDWWPASSIWCYITYISISLAWKSINLKMRTIIDMIPNYFTPIFVGIRQLHSKRDISVQIGWKISNMLKYRSQAEKKKWDTSGFITFNFALIFLKRFYLIYFDHGTVIHSKKSFCMEFYWLVTRLHYERFYLKTVLKFKI